MPDTEKSEPLRSVKACALLSARKCILAASSNRAAVDEDRRNAPLNSTCGRHYSQALFRRPRTGKIERPKTSKEVDSEEPWNGVNNDITICMGSLDVAEPHSQSVSRPTRF